MTGEMTSLERTLAALSYKDPDRVPLFLLTTMHGARELGVSIQEYFSSADNVAKGQIRLREKYQSDCYYTFFYAAIETEAQGGTVRFIPDGPANAGEPFLTTHEEIEAFIPPAIEDCPPLARVTGAIEKLYDHAGGTVPIIGVVMSPFSLPVMQMGFEAYLDLMYGEEELFRDLMKKNQEFCVSYANAQIEAGATAICYFDPVSSPTIVPPGLYRKTGLVVARETLPRIRAPTATHMASGRTLPIIGDLLTTGTALVGVSSQEDIGSVKDACNGRMSVIGNLNGIAMRRWTPAQAEEQVREVIRKAGAGGGLVLSDNHGEIPWQVPDTVLHAVSAAVRKWGRYPLG